MGSVVVTGVSSGIGRATASVLVRRGFHVFGSVRRETDAAALREALGEAVTPLLFDVTDEESVRRAAGLVRACLAGRTLAGLVNNAGIAVPGPLLMLAPADLRTQFEVNIVGLLVVTQAFAPLLGTDRSLSGPPGRIVNIGSALGRMGLPFVGPYVASKHALEGFSESLRRELLLFGVDVIVVAPGTVATPIWDKADAVDPAPFETSEYAPMLRRFRNMIVRRGRRGLPPERVGEVVAHALTVRRPRVHYAIVSRRFRDGVLPRLIRRRILDRLIARGIGMPIRGRGDGR